MQNPAHILGDTPLSTFLEEYWQQKPLLIRSAILCRYRDAVGLYRQLLLHCRYYAILGGRAYMANPTYII